MTFVVLVKLFIEKVRLCAYNYTIMISIVVPTMWKFAPFPDFLADVMESPWVSDVVLINNHMDVTPQHKIFNHSKLKVLDYGVNIFVNPAWNVGVMHAKSDLVCLANDDIIYDSRVFRTVLDSYQMNHGCYGISSRMSVDGDLELIPALGQDLFGYGQLMFVHKSKWIDIPPQLNVWYGDNFIFDLMIKYQYTNYIIKNLLFYTPHAQTAQHANPHMIQNEILSYKNVCEHYGMISLHP